MMEVARSAGVSAATVARVIYANGYVGQATRARVEAALQSTGYRPNVVARGLRTQRTFTIGHVLNEITCNPFFVHVARSLEREALRVGYKMFLFNHNEDAELERLGVERFIDRRVDAVIFNRALGVANIELLAAAGIPVIEIERAVTATTHSVLVDNPAGVSEGIRLLLSLGHRRIAFIGGDPAVYPHSGVCPRSIEEDRLITYRETLREAGASVAPELIRLGHYFHIADGGSNVEGYRHMQALLALPERPTAVFAACDILAAGALRAIYEARLRVPDDISVLGFDDTMAPHLTPRLTTIAQPMADMGSHALRIALAAIEYPTIARETVVLKPRLVVRESTGAVPVITPAK